MNTSPPRIHTPQTSASHLRKRGTDWSLPVSFDEPPLDSPKKSSDHTTTPPNSQTNVHTPASISDSNAANTTIPSSSYAPYVGPPLATHQLRLRILAWIWILAGIGVALRLIDIQIIRSERFTQRAAGQQERQIVLEARRGRIVDRNGVELSVSLPATSVAINPRKLRRASTLARRISAITDESSDAILRRINRPDRSFAWVVRNVKPEVAEQIRVLEPEAMMLLPGTRRVHPLAGLSGQLIGHVDIDNVGGDGIELLYNNALSGRNGWIRTLVDARGDRVANTAAPVQHAIDGGHVSLTIDADYQAILEHELSLAVEATGARSGRAVLLDASTGAIRAMANVPTYNPDMYRTVEPSKRRNRVITDPYEPGSTFKVVVASAVLAEKVMSPADTIDCLNGSIQIAGQRIRDSHPNSRIPFREVFSRSSNVGTIVAAQQLSSDDFYRYIRRFGFGAETGVGLPGESKGILAPTSRWSGRSHATLAIGQEIGVTALQMASAYAALANDGWLLRPYVVDHVVAPDGSTDERSAPHRVRQVVPENVARQMVELLTEVVDEGTGKTARIAGLRVAGKTGTAQIARADGRGYESGAYTASFAGFLPDMEPRLVCVVSIDRPKTQYYGSTVAGPVFRRIMSRILSRDTSIIRSTETTSGALMPNLVGMSKSQAVSLCDTLGVQTSISGTGSTVVGQWPPTSARLPASGSIELLLADRSIDGVRVPDVRNMSVREAIRILNSTEMNVELRGTGVVYGQYPVPGSSVAQHNSMVLYCREPVLSSPYRRIP